VCAGARADLTYPECLRTYKIPGEEPINCQIWEAARATTAAPKYFKPIEIGLSGGSKQKYIDGGIRWNNPVKIAVIEATALYGMDRKVGCVVSIESGLKGPVKVADPKAHEKWLQLNLISSLETVATDCEAIHTELRDVFSKREYIKDTYFRFNVDSIGSFGLAEWEHMDDINTNAIRYCRDEQVSKQIEKVVDALCIILKPKSRELPNGNKVLLADISM